MLAVFLYTVNEYYKYLIEYPHEGIYFIITSLICIGIGFINGRAGKEQ